MWKVNDVDPLRTTVDIENRGYHKVYGMDGFKVQVVWRIENDWKRANESLEFQAFRRSSPWLFDALLQEMNKTVKKLKK